MHNPRRGLGATSRLSRKRVSEDIADGVREEILSGGLQPGSRLRQNKIADEYGVSSTPVREALLHLQAQGLVQIDAHRGAFVFRPSISDLQEILEIRVILEVAAIRKTEGRVDSTTIDQLETLHEQMVEIGDDPMWVDLNNRFHMLLYQSSGAKRLVGLIGSLREASSAYFYMLSSSGDDQHRGDDEHAGILAAIRENDVDRAAEIAAIHINNTAMALLTEIEPVSGSAADESTVEE